MEKTLYYSHIVAAYLAATFTALTFIASVTGHRHHIIPCAALVILTYVLFGQVKEERKKRQA